MDKLRVEDLKAADYNPREIDDKSLRGLRESISRFGDIAGITFNIQTGRLVTGHQRVSTLQGFTRESEVTIDILNKYEEPTAKGTVATGYVFLDGEPFALRVVDWDESLEKLANVEANNPHVQGQFLADKLGILLSEFRQEDLEPLRMDRLIPLTQLTENLKEDGFGSKDPESKYEFVLGDVIKLGDHVLVCGDSTDPKTYEALMSGEKAHLVFTDPPYNVNYSSDGTMPNAGERKKKYKSGGAIMNDHMSDEDFLDFITDTSLNLYDHSTEDATFYMWHAMSNHLSFRYGAERASWKYKQLVIWVKDHFVLSMNQVFHRVHEPCLVLVKDHTKFKHIMKYRNMDDVWNKPELLEASDVDTWFVKRDMSEDYVHPTQKPIRLAQNAFARSTEEGDVVLDAFGGSGSTLMACEQSKRLCRMIELDPHYCSVIVERWEKFTGGKHDVAGNFLIEDKERIKK